MDNEFLSLFQEVLNSETPVEMSMRLEDIPEWDSLGFIRYGLYCLG